jgi:hypothetical protein
VKKTCSMCNETMCLTNFYKVGIKYYQSKCKKCFNACRKRVKKQKLTNEQIEYIKQNYGKIATTQISLNLDFSECYLRKYLRKLDIIPEDRIRKRGRPRMAVL